MHPRRGFILIVAGGAVAVTSLSMLGYYGTILITTIEDEDKRKIQPNGVIPFTANISNAEQGAYAIVFSDFSGLRPTVTLRDPSNQTIVGKAIGPPLALELFTVADEGIYTLTLSNPSSDQVLEAFALLGSQEYVLNNSEIAAVVMTTFALGSLLMGGIAAAVAGAVITVIDKRRLGKMKQFGDTSDLV